MKTERKREQQTNEAVRESANIAKGKLNNSGVKGKSNEK